MQTIADSLGISKSLVSLTLNDKYGVSSELRYLIFKKALELGYDFNYNYNNKNTDHKKNLYFYKQKFCYYVKIFWKILRRRRKNIHP